MFGDHAATSTEPPINLNGTELLRLEQALRAVFSSEKLGALGLYALNKALDEYSSKDATRPEVARDLVRTAIEDERLRDLLAGTKEFAAELQTEKGDELVAFCSELLQKPPEPSRPSPAPLRRPNAATVANTTAAAGATTARKRALVMFVRLLVPTIASYFLLELGLRLIPSEHETDIRVVFLVWSAGFGLVWFGSAFWIGRQTGWLWGIFTAIAWPIAIPAYEYFRHQGMIDRSGSAAIASFPILPVSVGLVFVGAAALALGLFVANACPGC